jgi:hypothetical protein
VSGIQHFTQQVTDLADKKSSKVNAVCAHVLVLSSTHVVCACNVQDVFEFVGRQRELVAACERLAAKPFKQEIAVTADDLPAETKEIRKHSQEYVLDRASDFLFFSFQ